MNVVTRRRKPSGRYTPCKLGGIMKYFAICESRLFSDGNHLPLTVGDRLDISFYLELEEITVVEKQECSFNQIIDSQYQFVGRIISKYGYDFNHLHLYTIDTGETKFYIVRKDNFSEGDLIEGQGELQVDPYDWLEFRNFHDDTPDLLFNLEVKRIRMVNIHERFIRKDGEPNGILFMPKKKNVQELFTMYGQNFDEEFYLIDFEEVL